MAVLTADDKGSRAEVKNAKRNKSVGERQIHTISLTCGI